MSPNILIVDDEELVLKSLQRVFRKEGYNLYFATNGQKALEIMEDVPIDLILSDQRMPGMTGTELLKIVKEKWPNTIRVIISGYADFEAVLSAINEGEVYRFVTKPWEDNSLRALVRRALEQGKVVKIFNKLVEHIKSVTPEHEVKTSYFSEKGKFVARIEDHKKGMNEKDIACLLKCVFDFFHTTDQNSDIAVLSSMLVKQMGRLTLITEVGEGTRLTIDMPVESKEEEKKDEE